MNVVVLSEDNPGCVTAVLPASDERRAIFGIVGTSDTMLAVHGACGVHIEYDANARKKNCKLNVNASLAFGRSIYGDAIVRHCDGSAWHAHVCRPCDGGLSASRGMYVQRS